MTDEFRLGIGGPFHRLERRILEPSRRLVGVAIAVTWVPLVALAAAQSALGRDTPLMRDLSVHVRMLVALPLFLVAERVLDRLCATTVSRLFDEGFVTAAQTRRVRDLLRRAERWRDSPWPEVAMLTLALASGVGAITGLTAPAGLVHGIRESRFSAVHIWYSLVSLPVFQFMLWRSLFRWALWIFVLGGLARTPLRLAPLHADRRGGIGFLKYPSLGYCAPFLLGVSAVLCAGWGTQIIYEHAALGAFKSLFYAFVIVGAVLAFGPLLLFVPMLFRAGHRGRRDVGALVTDYARAFEERWVKEPPPPELLGTPDMQSLADLSTSFQENVEKMQVLLFTPRDALLLFLVAQLPAIPILLTQVPAQQVLGRLLHLVTGGLPGG